VIWRDGGVTERKGSPHRKYHTQEVNRKTQGWGSTRDIQSMGTKKEGSTAGRDAEGKEKRKWGASKLSTDIIYNHEKRAKRGYSAVSRWVYLTMVAPIEKTFGTQKPLEAEGWMGGFGRGHLHRYKERE